MDACISINFFFIFFIIVKNYRKVKRPEPGFFERRRIAPVNVTDSITTVWTRNLSATKIVSE